MRRRDFLAALTGSLALPVEVVAQKPGIPLVGFLGFGNADTSATWLAGWRDGMAEDGFIEGRTVQVEYRWAESQNDRLASLAAELVDRRVAVIVAAGGDRPDISSQTEQIHTAARALRLQLVVLEARDEQGIEAAFATLAERGLRVLLVAADPSFAGHREQVVALAARAAVPAIYQWRDFVISGGLMSYGASLADAYRQAGIYVARILKGGKPEHLPVARPTKFELVINLKTAKALGLTVPQSLLARADEVIE